VGIYDRDYARANQPSAASGGSTPGLRSGRGSGFGSMRMLSVNTWLIILNVAVFALNNFVFQAVQWPVQQRREYFPGVTQEAVRLAKPDRTKLRSGEDGTLNYPLIVSQQDQAGRIWQTEVGQERFRAMRVIEAFGHFSLGKFWSGGEVWRLISFQFLHANLSHLVFNMLGLWFVGGLVEQYLGRRRSRSSISLVGYSARSHTCCSTWRVIWPPMRASGSFRSCWSKIRTRR